MRVSKYELGIEAFNEMDFDELGQFIVDALGRDKKGIIEFIEENFPEEFEDICQYAFDQYDAYVTDHAKSAPWRSPGW